MEVLKENLAKEVLKKLKEISELWDISSKKWKKLPDNEKQLFFELPLPEGRRFLTKNS